MKKFDTERLLARGWPAAAPLALVVALLLTSLVLLSPARTRSPPSAACSTTAPSPTASVQILNKATTYYLVGARGGHRLPDEPVQHRRRRPVPARRVLRRGRRRRADPARAAAADPADRRWSRCSSARCGPASPRVLKVTRGRQRGHLDDHAQRRSPTGIIAYLLRHEPARRRRPAANIVTTEADAGGLVPMPGIPISRRRPTVYGFIVVAIACGVALLVRCSAAPGSASTCGPPASPRPRRWPAASTSSGWSITAMLISGAVAGLVGMPLLLGDSHAVHAGLPDRHRLHRHRRSRCSAATTRSASRSARCCGASWTQSAQILDLDGHAKEIVDDHAGRHRAVGRHRLRAGAPLSARRQQQRRVGAELRRRGRAGGHRQRRCRHERHASLADVDDPRPDGGRAPAAGVRWPICCSASPGAARARLGRPADHRRQRHHLQRHHRRGAAAGRADRAGRPRRPVVRAVRRGQHRPRGHDDPRHLVRRLGRRTSSGPWVGVLVGIVGGALGGLVHAVATVTFGVDHIVSGVAINILGARRHPYLSALIFASTPGGGVHPVPAAAPASARSPCPASDGAAHAGEQALVPGLRPRRHPRRPGHPGLAAHDRRGAAGAGTYFLLWRTTFGLRLRSCGESPVAAESLGVNVYRMKYTAVIVSGGFAGLGGAFLALVAANIYREGQTGGRGYIGLAAMIFGNWRPGGLALGAGLFGYTDALQLRSGGESVHALLLLLAIVLLAARGLVAVQRPAAAGGDQPRRRPPARWSGTWPPTRCRTSSSARPAPHHAARAGAGGAAAATTGGGRHSPTGRGEGGMTAVDWAALRAARGRGHGAGRTRRTRTSRSAPRRWSTTAGWSSAATSRTPRTALGLCAECGLVSALHATGGGRLVAFACVDAHGGPLIPCGRCRQLLWEHGGPGAAGRHRRRLRCRSAGCCPAPSAARTWTASRMRGEARSEPCSSTPSTSSAPSGTAAGCRDEQIDWVIDAYTRGRGRRRADVGAAMAILLHGHDRGRDRPLDRRR